MATVNPKFGMPGAVQALSGTPTDVQTGGQGLVYVTGGKRRYGVAGAAATKFAGIARYDIPAAAAYIGGPKVNDANAQVAQRRGIFPVVASGAVAEGDPLICAAAGKFSTAGATPDARTVVGRATEAAADGATFEAEIF